MNHVPSLLFLLFFLVHVPLPAFTKPYLAITRVPVADLLGESAQKTDRSKNISSCYHQLPLCSQKPPRCSRLHQFLLHEIVTVLEEKNDEVYVSISSVYFETQNDTKKNTAYWTLKKNLIPLAHLEKRGIDLTLLPEPISFLNKKNSTQKIATLIEPFFDAPSKRTLSAGTRFVINECTKNTIKVYALAPSAARLEILEIPRNLLLVASLHETREYQIQRCLAILKKWAHQKNGCIPYVWGGSSFTAVDQDGDFIKQRAFGNANETMLIRPHYQCFPKTGFDCTGLLARAAQIAGIPYYFKNSTTMLKYLRELSPTDAIENGDIIWIPGHIMIITDVSKNLIVEARSYEHGWGKVHETSLNRIFNGINSLDHLLRVCTRHLPLDRLSRDGTVAQKIYDCKILSLRSIWDII